MAATYPPGPAPRTTTSKCWLMAQSLGGRPSGATGRAADALVANSLQQRPVRVVCRSDRTKGTPDDDSTAAGARPAPLTRVRRSLTRGEWTAIGAMAAVVVAAARGRLGHARSRSWRRSTTRSGPSQVFGIGLGLTAYTLGMRHAFDADHIAAIDNTTRKLMAEGKRPVTVGFWFSLGHSTIVFALCLLLALGVRSLAGQLENDGSTLQNVTGAGRHAGLGHVPLHPRDPEPGRSWSASSRCSATCAAGCTTRPRSRSSWTTGAHEPVPRRAHQVGAQAVADLPGRACCSGSASTPPPRSACWCSPAARPRSRCPGTPSSRCRCCSRPG